MRAPTVLSGLLVLSLLHACGTTKTGNPSASDEAPEGMVFLRSKLQREAPPALSQDSQRSFGRSSREFAFALYGQVRDESSNLFFSPYSIATALAMTYGGARGTTQTEMASALRFDASTDVHAAFNATEAALAKRESELIQSGLPSEPVKGQGFALELTNALFAQKGRMFQDDYLDLLARNYGSGVYLADFAAQPERERLAINDWVAERTMQRITELLPKGSIDGDVAFALVNTIYFKANWLEKFKVSDTAPAAFHAPNGDVTVQMMNGAAESYARLSDYQALELQYLSPDVRALFLLPDAGKLAAVEARLNDTLFEEARAALSRHSVSLKLPRFRYSAEFELKQALQGLGMRAAFSPGTADLSGMSGMPGQLYIDEVYHEAFVAMDEEGTEAAAATAVIGKDVSAPPPAEFFADRPFLFVIHDVPTGQILFVGRVTSPSE